MSATGPLCVLHVRASTIKPIAEPAHSGGATGAEMYAALYEIRACMSTNADLIRLELPFTLEKTTVNAYLCLEPEPTLVDTGDAAEDTWKALVAGLAQHGVSVRDLRRVIITHTHIDHFGQAARIADESNARFQIMDAGYSWLADFTRRWAARMDYYRDVFLPGTGMPVPLRAPMNSFAEHVLKSYRPVPAERIDCLHDGAVVRLGAHDWTTLHVPGHASMLTAFHAPTTRTLLASDMLLARTPTPVLEPPETTARYGRPLPTFVHSLARIAALEIENVLPGHGPPFPQAATVIAAQQARIATRRRECLELVRQGLTTAFDLHLRMYGLAPDRVNMAGLWMTIGYLDLLEEAGLITRDVVDGLWVHRASAQNSDR